MRVVPSRDARPRKAQRLILGPHTPEFSTYGAVHLQFLVVSAAGWPSANDPIAYPFRLSEGVIVDELGWVNGSAAGGNIDIGIYDSAWNRLVSAGSTAGTGNTQAQWVDVADTYVPPNTVHYLVMVADNTTTNRLRQFQVAGNALATALCGVQDSATNALPLPDPLTNMASATIATHIACALMACRARF